MTNAANIFFSPSQNDKALSLKNSISQQIILQKQIPKILLIFLDQTETIIVLGQGFLIKNLFSNSPTKVIKVPIVKGTTAFEKQGDIII
jgi:hypothetical protein